jgi:hypothetical protein
VIDFIRFHIHDSFVWPTFTSPTHHHHGVALLLLEGLFAPRRALRCPPPPQPRAEIILRVERGRACNRTLAVCLASPSPRTRAADDGFGVTLVRRA